MSETSLLRCNFCGQQYSAAAGVLEFLFKRIEPMDEWIAMRVAFLLLDVYIVVIRGCVADDLVLPPTQPPGVLAMMPLHQSLHWPPVFSSTPSPIAHLGKTKCRSMQMAGVLNPCLCIQLGPLLP